MQGLGPLDFSQVIAFLLPGFVSFFALTYLSPRVAELFQSLLVKGSGAGPSLVVLIFSLGAGVLTSGVRALLLDQIQFGTGVRRPKQDYSKLKQADTLKAFEAAVSNLYRFAQFYGNMLVSLVVLVAVKFGLDGQAVRAQPMLFGLLCGGAVVLFFSHRRSLRTTYERLAELLGSDDKKGETHGRPETPVKSGEPKKKEDNPPQAKDGAPKA